MQLYAMKFLIVHNLKMRKTHKFFVVHMTYFNNLYIYHTDWNNTLHLNSIFNATYAV